MRGARMIRRVATILALLAMASACTTDESNGPVPGTSATGSLPSGMEVRLTGDLQLTLELLPEPGGTAAGEDAESLQARWAAGDLEPPPVRFTDGENVVAISWPRWEEGRELSDVALTLQLGGYTVVPAPGACGAEVVPAGEFLLRGSLDCEQLSGVKPGGKGRPVFDLAATFTYRVYACVPTEQPDGVTYCGPIGPAG